MSSKRTISAVVLGCLLALAAAAQGPIVRVSDLPCVPQGEYSVVRAQLSSEESVRELRAYFRWHERANFYYQHMATEGGGQYWSVLPKPDEGNEAVEYYMAALDSSGKVLSKSPNVTVRVDEDCDVELTGRELGYAENLVIGETAESQAGKDILGFLCDGVVTRIGPDGILRADDVCRACVIAATDDPAAPVPIVAQRLAAAGVLFGGGVITTIIIDPGDPPEASPSRP